jgi:myosin heavy subunit
MDKYEYQLKTEHIRQVAARKEYGEAAKLCDTIDWTKIRDVKMLTLAADVYTAVGEYEKAIDILQQAYEYAAMGRRIVYRLTELALKADSYDDAKNYFEEFCRIAPNDQGRYILLYKMARYQKATLDEKIKILEAYKREDFDEKWAYELAVLYAMNNEKDKCIQLCDDIILWFGLGKYVEKALSLKSQFAPLTPAQKEKVQKFADKKAQEENEKLQKKQEEQEKKESQAELAKKAAAQEKISKWQEEQEKAYQAEQEAAKKEAKAREDEQKALLEREEKLRKQREEELEAVERLKKEQRLEHARQSVVTSDMNEIMAVIQRAKQEDAQNELQDELAKQVQQVQQLAGEKDLELVSEIPSDVEEKEKMQVPEDISYMQDEISENETTESEVLDDETSENENSDVETANTETSEKTSDSENTDEAVWFEAYKPEEEPQISEWAAPVAETVEVEPEEEVQEEPEKEPEEEEPQEVVQEELEKEPEEAGPHEEIQEESKKEPEEAETQEEIQEEIQEEPEEEETQEEFEEEPEEEDAQEESEEELEVKDAQEESAESRQVEMTANSGLPIVNPEDMSRVWHFAIQAMPDEDDIELALEYLEELAECSSRAVPRSVVKITGQKLNQKGLVKSIDKLLGKTILIEDAADMNERVINEFCKIIDPTDRSLLVVFIDTPASIRHLLIDYPQLAQVVTAQFVRETYSVTELLEYARGYADREDSVFDKSGELALMERLKVIAGNQERNKKRIVEMIVNNAIEKAEKKSMRKLFQSKYDKRGCLILRDKDFEVG